MGAEGFWDDAERAAEGRAPSTPARRGAWRSSAALAARRRGPRGAGRDGRRGRRRSRPRSTSRSPRSRRAWRELEEQRLFSGRYDAGDALVTRQRRRGRHRRPGLGRDGAADADALGRDAAAFEVELLEVSPGEEAGIKSATFRVSGENAYGLFGAERGVHRLVRLSPFDSAHRRQTSFAGRRGGAGRGGQRRGRDRRRRPAGRHLPRLRRRRPARQQDRLGGADHAPADAGSSCSARTSARSPPTGRPRWRCCAPSCSSARSANARRRSRARRGRPRTSTSARRSAPTCCTPTRWSRTTAPARRSGDVQRVLDGDLDGFVRALLLQRAASGD